MNRASGGRTEVTYGSSAQIATGTYPNQFPAAEALVKTIVEKDGRGNARTTSFGYANGRYDFINRKILGYQTITAQLDPIAGESQGPLITTSYDTANFASFGVVTARQESVGGTVTWSNATKTWSLTRGGTVVSITANTAPETGGPFVLSKTGETVAVRSGSSLVETATSFTYTSYGQPLTVTDYGLTSGGTNLATGDDTTTSFTYQPNLSDYIVDRPASRIVNSGAAASSNRATWLSAEFYRYDGAAAETVAPTDGNLTGSLVWMGDPANLNQRSVKQASYDDWGNVLTERDAAGSAAVPPYDLATHTYDTSRHLFRLTTTDALNHLTSTTWDTGCQEPLTVTDANSLVTTMTYDLFCRATRKDLPTGQYDVTRYVNFGSPTTQYIEHESKSASNVAGSTLALARSYFDGLGHVYMTTAPGVTSAIADAITQLRGYDARGNLSWTSIPLSWAAAATYPAPANQRTTIDYDSLDRPVKTTYADGTYDTLTYTTGNFSLVGTALDYPGVKTSDADCFDAPGANTPCVEVTSYADAAGRKVRDLRVDAAGTDTTSLTGANRITDYRYDLLGRLTSVTDPEGIPFSYQYDIYGNRTQASDPGLGTWTMSYDLNNNLALQTDSSGQTISFAYNKLNAVTLKTVQTPASQIKTAYTYDENRGAAYSNIGRATTLRMTNASGTVLHVIYDDYAKDGQLSRRRHVVDANTYTLSYSYYANGARDAVSLPNTPGATTSAYTAGYQYDGASRFKSLSGSVTSVTYDLRSQPVQVAYANGASETTVYDPPRGWVTTIDGYQAGGAKLFHNGYVRSATGRILQSDTSFTIGSTTYDKESAFSYAYDYAGRLRSATNMQGVTAYSQSFAYDGAGRMRTNSRVGTYAYLNPTVARQAPSSVTPATGPVQAFTYDANGNMTAGLDGKAMAYAGKNRPLSVTFLGKKTCYVYGADGARLKKVENYAPAANCSTAPTASQPVTLYLGEAEIRMYGQGNAEQILQYPLPGIRIQKTKNAVVTAVSTLHRDALGSVRAVTAAAGAKAKRSIYRPYGEEAASTFDLATLPETKGFIGERYDADAGLQYLNARYYDPKLGLFLQPDWWEVMQAGVGTNRYGYAGGDPVNGGDPGGHCAWDVCLGEIGVVAGLLGLIGGAEIVSDVTVDGELNGNGALAQTGKAAADFISKSTAGIGNNGGPAMPAPPGEKTKISGNDLVDNVLAGLGGVRPLPGPKGAPPNWEATGADLKGVIEGLEREGIKLKPSKNDPDVLVGELPNGDTVVVRPDSKYDEKGRPTVEVQRAKDKKKQSETRLGSGEAESPGSSENAKDDRDGSDDREKGKKIP